jgi:membrane protein
VPLPKLTSLGFLKALWQRISSNAATDRAAQLSYYFLFALFPALFFAVTLAAYLPLHGAVEELLARLDPVMPEEAEEIIRSQLVALTTEQRPHLMTLGLALSIWSASRGVDALRSSLNRSFGVRESRPWWRVQITAIAVTIATAVLLLLAVGGIALGGNLGLWLATRLHVDQFWPLLWGWLRWPITALGVVLLFSVLYYFLPDVKQRWRLFSPGALVGTLLWLLASWGFSVYADNFGSYDTTYGSIGGVIVLLTWLYVTGLIFILGGEINGLEREFAERVQARQHQARLFKYFGVDVGEPLHEVPDSAPSFEGPTLA